jgi:PAS domain S-box-containing protein
MMVTIGRKIIYVNKRLSQLLNYACDDLVNTDVLKLTSLEDQAILNSWIERLTEKRNVNYMIREITGDVNYIWVKVTSICLSKYNLSFSFLRKVGHIPAAYASLN